MTHKDIQIINFWLFGIFAIAVGIYKNSDVILYVGIFVPFIIQVSLMFAKEEK